MRSRTPAPLLVIGLGNPGREYAETRHNAGFLVIEALAERLQTGLRRPFLAPWREGGVSVARAEALKSLVLIQPLTFMNASGSVLPPADAPLPHRSYGILVIYDTLDLPPGRIRLRRSGSSGGQRGMESIIRNLGSRDFSRLAVGIGRPPRRDDVVDWVLSPPQTPEELETFRRGVVKAADAVLELIDSPLEQVMNRCNVLS